jgi:hypothetical protein
VLIGDPPNYRRKERPGFALKPSGEPPGSAGAGAFVAKRPVQPRLFDQTGDVVRGHLPASDAAIWILATAAAVALLHVFSSILWPFALAAVLTILIQAYIRAILRVWRGASRRALLLVAAATVLLVLLGVPLVVQFPSLWPSLVVFLGVQAIAFVVGNVVWPKLQADRQNIDPSVGLLSVGAWSIILGLPGAFLATPLSLLYQLAGSERLRWIAVLLSHDGDPLPDAGQDASPSVGFRKIRTPSRRRPQPPAPSPGRRSPP